MGRIRGGGIEEGGRDIDGEVHRGTDGVCVACDCLPACCLTSQYSRGRKKRLLHSFLN